MTQLNTTARVRKSEKCRAIYGERNENAGTISHSGFVLEASNVNYFFAAACASFFFFVNPLALALLRT